MSTLSGLTGKGEKQKGKFTTFNINNIYKGTSNTPQRSTTTRTGHGLQSLGKIPSARRMPPPAHLPSLKKEYSGNDPTVSLVPTGGSGWGNGKDDEKKASGSQAGTSSSLQGSPAAAGVVVEKSQGQGPTPGPTTATIQGRGTSQPTHGTQLKITGASTPPQPPSPPDQHKSTLSTGGTNSVGGKSWSSVTGGNKKQGGFLDQKSPFFQEEFPKLAISGEDKSPGTKKEEESRELPYGPGPSLRPQNVGSWREGGGRAGLQQQSQSDTDQPQLNSQTSGGADIVSTDGLESPTARPPQAHPPLPPGQPQRPPHPMGPGINPMMMRGMMPHYMYRFPVPPNYPGMPRPPFLDQRYRGPLPPQSQMDGAERFSRPDGMDRYQRSEASDRYPENDRYQRPEGVQRFQRVSIIKDEVLREFDEGPNDGGWAGAQLEMDFSAKLRFSDDEDIGVSSKSNRDNRSSARDRSDSEQDFHDDHDRHGSRDKNDGEMLSRQSSKDTDRDVDEWDTRDREKPPFDRQRMDGPVPCEAWGPPGPMPSYGRPVDWQQRMPFDHRGPMNYGPPYRGPPMVQRPSFMQPGPHGAQVMPPGAAEPDEEDILRQRRQQKMEDVSAAVLRARQRREEEERRMEEQRRAGANERLRQLDEKSAKKEKDKDKESDRASNASDTEKRSRTASESSDKERHRERETKGLSKGQKNLPPRLQKTCSSPQTSGSGPKPMTPTQSGPPVSRQQPQGWSGYDARWSNMPSQFMDARMPARSQMDMSSGLPFHGPFRRPRNESGSNGHVHDGDHRPLDVPFEPRDLRAWHDCGPFGPPSGWDDQMRRGPVPHQFHGCGSDYDKDYDQRAYDHKEPTSHSDSCLDGSRERLNDMPHDKVLGHKDAKGLADDASLETSRKEDDKASSKSDRSEGSLHQNHTCDRSDSIDKPTDWAQMMESDDWDKEVEREQERQRQKEHLEKHSSEDTHKADAHGKKDTRPQDKPDSRERTRREKDQGRNRRMQSKYHGDYRDDEWHDGYPPRDSRLHESGSGRRKGEMNAPPPIPLQQVQHNTPPRSNYTSLKRSHSTLSNNSANSDRKTESPKPEALPKTTEEREQKAPPKEPSKDTKGSKTKESSSQQQPTKSDSDQTDVSRQTQSGPQAAGKDSDKPDDLKKEDLHKDVKKEPKEQVRRDNRRKDQRTEERPPAKKMRDDTRQQSYYGDSRERSRSGRGRANSREFVRGGRSSRGRSGYSSLRGRGRSARDGQQSGYDYEANRASRQYRDIVQKGVGGQQPEASYGVRDFSEEPAVSNDSGDGTQSSAVAGSSESNDKLQQDSQQEDGKAKEGREQQSQSEATGRKSKDHLSKSHPDRYNESGQGSVKSGERRRRNANQSAKERQSGRLDGNQQEHDDIDDGYREDDGQGDGHGSYGQGSSVATHRGEPSRRGGGSRREGRGRTGGRYGSAPPRTSGGYGKPQKKESVDGEMDEKDHKSYGSSRHSKSGWRPGATAPRFTHGTGLLGRGRAARNSRARGTRGASLSASRTPARKPQLTKQNSSDLGNEEWETASESSDVFEKKEVKNDANKENKDKREVKKSFSNQRPSNDRQNRRNNYPESRKGGGTGSGPGGSGGTDSSVNGRSGMKEKSPPSARSNGSTPGTNRERGGCGGGRHEAGRNEVNVYRMDQVVHQDPTAIQNAINNLNNNKNEGMSKKSDLTDVSKPLKSEKEKKDALANIDINNYASVVVIDNQPEVTIDDPNYLFEMNEGFQEVTSKKSQRQKQKLVQEQTATKKAEQSQQGQNSKKKDDGRKEKGAKSKPAVSLESKRRPKLPPRLAKQREQKDKEKHQRSQPPSESAPTHSTQDMMPKIENWNNEMANNVMSPVKGAGSKEQTPPQQDSAASRNGRSALGNTFPVNMPVPAPKPSVNAWDKPMSMAVTSSSAAPSPISSKFNDKGDQPDSGIDISEPVNSAASSTRSSPSAESKIKADDVLPKGDARPDGKESFDAPKPQRQPKGGRSSAKSAETQAKISTEESSAEKTAVNKKTEAVQPKVTKVSSEPSDQPVQVQIGSDGQSVDAIQLPANFSEPYTFSKEDESGFTFTFNGSLGGLTQPKGVAAMEETKSLTTQVNVIQSPTSPATDELGQKIANAKTVWEKFPDSSMYEHGMPGSPGQLSSNSATVSVSAADIVSASVSTSAFGTFGTSVESSISNHMPSQDTDELSSHTSSALVSNSLTSALGAGGDLSPALAPSGDLSSALAASGINASMNQVLAYAQSATSVMSSSDLNTSNKNELDHSNVCKVKPQQLTQQQQQQMMNGSASMTSLAGMASLHSPPPAPVIIQQMSQYHPFPAGSSTTQLLGQDTRYNQTGYGFALTQQPQTALAQQQTALGQPTFSQPSLFIQPAPPATGMTQTDLYGSASQLPPQYRSQYGQSQQQSTIMVSSTSSTLMSAAIKPPAAQNQFISNAQQKSSGLQALSYGPLVGLGSQMFVQYDPGQPVNTNQPAPAPTPAAGAANAPSQNVNSSQLIGSHIVGQRTNLPPVQNQSSFYTQQPLQQTGFYQAQQNATNIANLQGAIQQVAAAPSQFSLPGFNTQPQNLSLPIQAVNLPGQSQLNKSATPFKPAAQQQQTQPPAGSQVKSPNNSDGGSSSFSGSMSGLGLGSNTFQQYGSNKLQQMGQQQTPSYSQQHGNNNQSFDNMMTQQQQANSSNNTGTSGCMQQQYQPQQQMLFQQQQQQQQQQVRTDHHRSGSNNQRAGGSNAQGTSGATPSSNQSFPHKMNSAFVSQQIAPAAPLVRAHLMMALRGPAAANTVGNNRFSTPLQQQNQPQQQNLQQSHSNVGSRQTRSSHSSGLGHGLSSHSGSSSNNQNMKALQAKERQEALAHAASFLNQQSSQGSSAKNNKPAAQTGEKSDSTHTEITTTTESEKKEEKSEN